MDIQQMNALELAFVGDAVYELLVRENIAKSINSNPNTLHKMAVEYVRAEAQSAALRVIEPLFTETEANIARRGRNSTKVTVPKSASPRDYRAATALEAVFGYLHLSGQTARINELMTAIFNTPAE